MTLIENVVVIATIGVLIGIVIPAVQLVRDAAARGACQSHLRQIGLALHGYHAQHGRFPSGGHPWNSEIPFSTPSVPWHSEILPYLEQDNLWAQAIAAWELDSRLIEIPPHSAKATVVPVFL